MQVTAHRGHARAAPENTLSAMRKAIESGADYAEMDVQLTAISFELLTADLATAARARPLVEPSPANPPRQHLLALRAMPPHLEESPRTEEG